MASHKNKVSKKETNEQMHGRNIRSGRDSNQGLPDNKPILLPLRKREFSLTQLSGIVSDIGKQPGMKKWSPVTLTHLNSTFINERKPC